jgi:hypothetical protein
VALAAWQWSGNGHYYEAVEAPQGISWHTARLAAEEAGGHLATIASLEENDFVYGLIAHRPELWFYNRYGCGIGPWLGGFQLDGWQEPGEGWRWVSGELFHFTNWAWSEPNNFPLGVSHANVENALGYIGQGQLTSDRWNDYPAVENRATGQFAPRGYIVEWTFFVCLPEPEHQSTPAADGRPLWARCQD